MPTRRTILAICILGGTAALAGTLAGRWASGEPHTKTTPEPILGLVIESSDLSFGEVVGDRNFSLRLPVRNVTDRAIHIGEFRTGCECRPVEPKSLTIPGGETREIRLILDGAKLTPRTIGQLHRVDTELRPVIDGKPAAKAWQVTGTILPAITTDLPAVLFGDSNRIGEAPVVRTVRVRLRTLGVPSATVSPSVADVQIHRGSGVGEWNVVVSPRTNRSPGAFRGKLTITNLSPDGNQALASLDLPIEGVLLEAKQ